MPGAAVGERLADRLGRPIPATAAIFVGVASLIWPLYVPEISPPGIGGSAASPNQLALAGGLLASCPVGRALFVGTFFAVGPCSGSWSPGSTPPAPGAPLPGDEGPRRG